MENSYLTLKAVHVAMAVVFMGNVLLTALWKTLADRTRDARVIAFSQRLVTLTDIAFTMPGAALLLISGLFMATRLDPRFWHMPWVAGGVLLLLASGMVWLVRLAPIQAKQARLAKAFAEGGEVPPEFYALSRSWARWGVVATFLPLVNFYLMVFKPA